MENHVTIGVVSKEATETNCVYMLYTDKTCDKYWEDGVDHVYYGFDFLKEAMQFIQTEGLILDNSKKELAVFKELDKQNLGEKLTSLIEKFEKHYVGRKQFDSVVNIYKDSIMADVEKHWSWNDDFRLNPEGFISRLLDMAYAMIEDAEQKRFAENSKTNIER